MARFREQSTQARQVPDKDPKTWEMYTDEASNNSGSRAGLVLISQDKHEYKAILGDHFTKWIKAKSLATITGKKVVSFFFDHTICRFGVPQTIISDNGQQPGVAMINPKDNKEALRLSLDILEEKRDNTATQIAHSKHHMAKYYNRKVHLVSFKPRDHVLKKIEVSKATNTRKMAPRKAHIWSGKQTLMTPTCLQTDMAMKCHYPCTHPN
ncbi:reverse transcriptase domain-containing protein [Tanacetum coccineum]|uniref:Reverse transcriptase domain-containing protein n=1 Tax=Tanacetum coccineum TaxID=301880 RepID=A0ABQ4ZQX2_9ASTR